MQHNQSTTIVQSIITFLVVQLDRAIDEQSLLLNLLDFAAKQFLQILSQMSNTAVLQSPAERMFKEDILGQIPKLEKDTLMPKDLSQEKGRPPSPRKNSPRSSASSMRKIAFKKRQQSSIVQRLQSVTMKEKKASKQSKKSQKPPLFPLSQQQPVAEQEIVQGLRDKTQTRLQYYQQQNKLKEQRQHIFQSKLNELNSIIHEDPKTNITYDYGGDALKSNISQHQNVKVVMTRTGISFASKRLKDGLTNMMPQPSKIQVRPRNAKSYKDQIPSSSIKPLQLPLFQMKLVQENNIKNLKLQQYKKFYGKKYNRLDSRNNTIDMNQSAKTTYKQDVFVQKKHMRDNDNQQQNPSKGVIKTKSSTNRKLALPKLNGKYKVLDRYQQ